MADMSLGLATAPILYAAEGTPAVRDIIKRRFKQEVGSAVGSLAIFSFAAFFSNLIE